MMIKKKIVKIGTSYGIVLDKLVMKSLNLKEGDEVDISDIVKIKKGEKNDN